MDVRVPDATSTGMPYVVEVGGDIDLATVDDLEVPVIGAIEQGRRPLVLDLTDCAFMDSSGLRLLLRAHRVLQTNGDGHGPPMVVIARDHVAGLLRLTSVDKVIPVVASRGEAEGLLASPSESG
jgi:anti-sigma B factor antagonist